MPLNFSPTVPPFSLFPRLVASFKDKKKHPIHSAWFVSLINIWCINKGWIYTRVYTYNAHNNYWNNLLPNNGNITSDLCIEIIQNLFQDHLNLGIKYVKVIKIKSFDSYLYIYFLVNGCHIFYIGYHVSSNFIMFELYKWHTFGRKCSQN